MLPTPSNGIRKAKAPSPIQIWPSCCLYVPRARNVKAARGPDLNRTRVNTLRPRQNGRHFADDIFNCIFLNENVWIPIKISLKFVPEGPINNIPSLVQIMVWRRPGAKPFSGPMMVSLLTDICVTRPQWVKAPWYNSLFNSFPIITPLWCKHRQQDAWQLHKIHWPVACWR